MAAENSTLPRMGPAPSFELTTHTGDRLSLSSLAGKVVVVSFVYTNCPDICPMVNAKLLAIERGIDSPDLRIVSVTLDPEDDTPSKLSSYAGALGGDPARWTFVTGTEEQIRDVATRYGIFFEKQSNGLVDHNLLTSLIDRSGTLRVQYMGSRFDIDEFTGDLIGLLEESHAD